MRKLCAFVIAAVSIAALAVIGVTNGCLADEKPIGIPAPQIPIKDVPKYLQEISVTCRSARAEGSGVFKMTKDGQVWIWTCGHLVDDLRTERKLTNNKIVVEFGDVKVIRVLTEEGRKIGEMLFDAQVIRYSDSEHGDDLALLRLRSKEFKPASSVQFYLDKEIPSVGSKLLHCGSLLGKFGSNSLTSGISSQVGRLLIDDRTVFDQTNCATWPGSSGGIICLEGDGRYVGMLVRGAGETFGFYVPVRRMREWAKKVGVEFAMDDSLPVPTDAELNKLPIDDMTIRGENIQRSGDNTKGIDNLSFRLFNTEARPRTVGKTRLVD